MEPSNSVSKLETVDHVVERLLLWAKTAGRGLARVEFVSDLSRERVVNVLRSRLSESSIAFREIILPLGKSTPQVIDYFNSELAASPPGLVSITGFGAAIQENEKTLYSLNAAREKLAAHPVKQIWWMPRVVVTKFIQKAPDLNSWFIVRLCLTEIIPRPELQQPEWFETLSDELGSLEKARQQAHLFEERFVRSLDAGDDLKEIAAEFLYPAFSGLMSFELRKESDELARRVLRLCLNRAKKVEIEERAKFLESLAAVITLVSPNIRKVLEGPLSTLANEKFSAVEPPEETVELKNLAMLLRYMNRFSEAEPLLHRALEIDTSTYGKDHPIVATDLNNLAQLLQMTSRLAEAEALVRRALEIDERAYGKDHPMVARDLNNLALLLQETNRLSEAEPLMRRALEIDERTYGKQHPKAAIRLNNLASLLHDTNRLSEAERLVRRALQIDKGVYAADHPIVAKDMSNLAALLYATSGPSEAEDLMRRALSILENSLGEEHPKTVAARKNLDRLIERT